MIRRKFQALVLVLVMGLGGVSAEFSAVQAAQKSSKNAAENQILKNGKSIGDVAMPAGAEVDTEDSIILGNGSNAYGKILAKVKADQMKVADYFKDHMPQEGWGLISEMQDDDILLTFQKPTRVATIRIERGSKVKLTIMVSPRN
ncbi:hypothetical protein [Kordiimonas sp.]|uniref:hypothetical protein n=1 Tax=Kordiimonas sp. TaxID=1970157 RepID=UPI003A90D8FA